MTFKRRLGASSQLRIICAAVATLGLTVSAKASDLTRYPKLASAQVAPGSYRDMIVLTVDKSNFTAELKTWPEDPDKSTTLRKFRIAIGKAEGDKQTEGDNRTPEGIYFVQSHIPGGSLPEKYGKLAIPIDFPNPMDRIDGKTGHGIWLHGVDHDQRVEEAKVTEGCVAFHNDDIARLSPWLKGHQGAVVIASDMSKVNIPEEMAQVKRRTEEWMGAWAHRQVDSYISFYAPDFHFERMNLSQYRDYKRRVFGSYKNMQVAFQNLRVITHPKYAVSIFNQDFHGDKRFTSIGRKILYWKRGLGGNWLVEREVFENRRFEFVTFTDAELALLSDKGPSITSDTKDKQAPSSSL